MAIAATILKFESRHSVLVATERELFKTFQATPVSAPNYKAIEMAWRDAAEAAHRYGMTLDRFKLRHGF